MGLAGGLGTYPKPGVALASPDGANKVRMVPSLEVLLAFKVVHGDTIHSCAVSLPDPVFDLRGSLSAFGTHLHLYR